MHPHTTHIQGQVLVLQDSCAQQQSIATELQTALTAQQELTAQQQSEATQALQVCCAPVLKNA
jgi:hypothetical protein